MTRGQNARLEDNLISDRDFARVRDLARLHFGIALAENKRVMVTRRLGLLANELGAEGPSDLVRRILARPNATLLFQLAEFLTTNHTYFHREAQHFERLCKEVLPALCSERGEHKHLRIWSAAAATGEEPYELAMCVREVLGVRHREWALGILATDISARALRVARRGQYSAEQTAKLPRSLFGRYFEASEPGHSIVLEDVRRDVSFRRLNLLCEPYPFQRRFQIVFLRNVMIYFDPELRVRVLTRILDVLDDEGYLFLGRSESAQGFESRLRFLEPGVYQKVES